MDRSRRQKKVSSLIKEKLSRLLIQEIQDSASGLITITRVEMSPDLREARIYLGFYGAQRKEAILAHLEKRKGYLRKLLASEVKLKYNPMLIFFLDPSPEYEDKIDRLISITKQNEK